MTYWFCQSSNKSGKHFRLTINGFGGGSLNAAALENPVNGNAGKSCPLPSQTTHFREEMKKNKTVCSIISGIISVIITSYFLWLGATLFAVSGDQRDLQARMIRVEKDTEYIRSRVDTVVQPTPTQGKTIIAGK
jgi:hypothetical protein